MDSLEGNKVVDKNAQENIELTRSLESETVERLVGKSIWRNEALQEATFTSLELFESTLKYWGQLIEQHLIDHAYNSIVDYVLFYRDYSAVATWHAGTKKPIDFYRDYQAKINAKYTNWTGLSMSLLESLKKHDLEFGSYFAVVSSQYLKANSCNSTKKYKFESANAVKDHVLVCLKFALCDRKGYVLLDSSLNVTHPIVVMRDEAYPHTNWFEKYDKEYHYKAINDRFIHVERRRTNESTGLVETRPHFDLIYIEKEYLSYESVAHKRSLLRKDKSLRFRCDGCDVATVISNIKSRNLEIEYFQYQKDTNEEVFVEHDFSLDQLESEPVQQALRNMTECVADYCFPDAQSSEIERMFQMYLQILLEYRKALADEQFTRDVCAMDEWIDRVNLTNGCKYE